MTVRIITGDCREILRTLPADSVHCCVTSPPYFGLRDYGVDGQMGLEQTPDEFIAGMVAVFAEVRRVLRADGTLWLNIGDSYAGSRRGGDTGTSGLQGSTEAQDESKRARTTKSRRRDDTPIPRSDIRIAGIKPKDMVGVPWMLAFALRADGWYLRQDIIWHKKNPMPESVRDRCTKAHEYLFLLSKSDRYYFDAKAIAEAASPNTHGAKVPSGWDTGSGDHRAKNGRYANAPGVTPKSAPEDSNIRAKGSFHASTTEVLAERNKRSVWTVPTMPFKEAHFATFPPALIEPCILAGAPQGGVVLDPFGGAGTTGLVADRHQRDAVLIELNPEYSAMAERRIRADAALFAQVHAATGSTASSGSTTTASDSSSASGSPETSSRSAP